MRKYSKHISKQDTLNIPYTENDLRDFIMLKLKKYIGRTFYNKNLGVNISVISSSVRETAQNCRPNRKAAELAVYLPYILRNAKVIKLHLPTESKTQKERFNFTEIAELRCNVKNIGVAKVIVGYRKQREVIEYSITNFQNMKNKTT